jgi:hypothetical protein
MVRPQLTRVRALAIASLVTVIGGAVLAQDLARRDADRMAKKVTAMEIRSNTPTPKGKALPPLRTSFTEAEINAYLKYNASSQFPAGLVDPRVTLVGDGRVSARAMVDLDAVRRSRPRGALDPMNLLTGSVEVTAAGVLRGTGGMATLDLESATVSGITMPKAFLQELVSYYSKSADHPEGVSLDKPFPLPAHVTSFDIQKGLAIVVQ